MVVEYALEDLLSLRQLLKVMPSDLYQEKIDILSGSSLGEHTRHVLEFYGCLLFNTTAAGINYDGRKRSQKCKLSPILPLRI